MISLCRTWNQLWPHLAEDADGAAPHEGSRWQHNERNGSGWAHGVLPGLRGDAAARKCWLGPGVLRWAESEPDALHSVVLMSYLRHKVYYCSVLFDLVCKKSVLSCFVPPRVDGEDPVRLRVRDQCHRLPGHVLPAEPHEHDGRLVRLRSQCPGLLPATHDSPLQLRCALLLTVSHNVMFLIRHQQLRDEHALFPSWSRVILSRLAVEEVNLWSALRLGDTMIVMSILGWIWSWLTSCCWYHDVFLHNT